MKRTVLLDWLAISALLDADDDVSKVVAETLRQYHEDKESASLFRSREHPLLGGRSPLDVAQGSTAGAERVLKLLARAEAGNAT